MTTSSQTDEWSLVATTICRDRTLINLACQAEGGHSPPDEFCAVILSFIACSRMWPSIHGARQACC